MEGNFNPYLRGTQHLEKLWNPQCKHGLQKYLTYCSWNVYQRFCRVRCLLLLLGTIQILKIFFFDKMSGTLELCLLRELLPRRLQFCFILWPGATEPDLNCLVLCIPTWPPPLSLCGGLFCDPCWLILPSEVTASILGYTSLIVCGKRLGESLKLGKLVYDEILLLFSR